MADSDVEQAAGGLAPALALVALGVASLWMPWVRVEIASHSKALRGIDLHRSAALVIVGLTVAAVGSIHAWRTGRTAVATLAFACLAWGAALIVITIEASAAAIPATLVPKTIRRQLFDASAGGGAWMLLCISGAGSLVTALPRTQLLRGANLLRRSWVDLTGGAMGIIALLLLGSGRYRTWFDVDGGAGSASASLWQLPWIGPWSMVALWAAGIALVTAYLTRRALPHLLLSGISFGWIFLAALCMALPRTLGRARLGDALVRLTPRAADTPLAKVALEIHVGTGPATVCWAGMMLAVASLLLMWGGSGQ